MAALSDLSPESAGPRTAPASRDVQLATGSAIRSRTADQSHKRPSFAVRSHKSIGLMFYRISTRAERCACLLFSRGAGPWCDTAAAESFFPVIPGSANLIPG
jgi:hypothetical protein